MAKQVHPHRTTRGRVGKAVKKAAKEGKPLELRVGQSSVVIRPAYAPSSPSPQEEPRESPHDRAVRLGQVKEANGKNLLDMPPLHYDGDINEALAEMRRD